MAEQLTHTVHCYSDKSKRKHFTSKQEAVTYAVTYANSLLSQGLKARIFPYSPPKKYIDILAERGPNG
jgi:hypothetical protein